MSDSEQQQPWAILAHVRKPQGRVGEVFADILTDFPEKFAERKRLFLLPPKGEARELSLEDHWLHKGGVVLKFVGVDDINAAELLKGFEVAIPVEERVPLGEDEVYISDLIGCVLVDVSGAEPVVVGTVTGVDKTAGPVDLLEVEREGTGKDELLVPFAKAYLRKLDVAGRRVEMALPEGLTEL
jgi:16S rRNA processing protein RimM